MKQHVLDILSQARRRLLAARAIGAAAVLVATAAMAAASLEAAWAMRGLPYDLGLLSCALPLIAGLLLLLVPLKATLPRLQTPLAFLVAGLLIATGVAGVLVFATSVNERIPRAMIPIVLLPAAALAAVLLAYLRPPSLRQVAVMLDLRLDLRERLSTAMELIERGSAGLQVAGAGLSEVIFAQAAGQARKAGVERMRFESVSRPAAGALGLSVLLAIVLLAPGSEGERFYANSAEIGEAFATMSPQQKHGLAEELARAAASAPTLQDSRDLRKAADAASHDDPQALKEAVARLDDAIKKGILKVVKVESPEAVAGRMEDATNGSGPSAIKPPPGNKAAAAGNSAGPANLPDAALVLVRPPDKTFTGNQAPAAGNSPEGGSYVSFDKAWERAVSQANQSLRDGQVPPRCQQLVRDYFLARD